MKRFLSICMVGIMLISIATTALADADIREFSFVLDGTIASEGKYVVSSQTATKYSSSYKYGSVRVTSWNGYQPNKNVYTGLTFQNCVPVCEFMWIYASKSLPQRVTPKLNDPTLIGSQYKYCAAMRLNTVETAATVKAAGIFTPDGL